MANVQDLVSAYSEFQQLVKQKTDLGKCSPQFISVTKLATDIFVVRVKPKGERAPLTYTIGRALSDKTQRQVTCFCPRSEKLGKWEEGLSLENVTRWLQEKNMLLKRDIEAMSI